MKAAERDFATADNVDQGNKYLPASRTRFPPAGGTGGQRFESLRSTRAGRL